MRCRRFVSLACGALLLAFATPTSANEPQVLDEVLLAYVEAWNSGRLSRLDQIVTDDFRRHAGPGESCTSAEQLAQLIRQSRKVYKRLRFEVDDHMTEARGGAFRGSFYGVHSEIDRVVEFDLMSMFRFEDGRIAEEWVLGNNFLVLVGLGYQLTPPGFEVIDPSQDLPASDPTPEPPPEPQAITEDKR